MASYDEMCDDGAPHTEAKNKRCWLCVRVRCLVNKIAAVDAAADIVMLITYSTTQSDHTVSISTQHSCTRCWC